MRQFYLSFIRIWETWEKSDWKIYSWNCNGGDDWNDDDDYSGDNGSSSTSSNSGWMANSSPIFPFYFSLSYTRTQISVSGLHNHSSLFFRFKSSKILLNFSIKSNVQPLSFNTIHVAVQYFFSFNLIYLFPSLLLSTSRTWIWFCERVCMTLVLW